MELGTDTSGNLDKDQNARIVVGESGTTADLSETDSVNKYNQLKS
ncbi:hypothetical protein [Brevinema andersonii]|nr:hypothetical protein [Brevinema andersonii]